MSTKAYSIYRIPDKRCPDGYMKKADGPAIQRAIKEGKLTPNDTWDCDEERLIRRLMSKLRS